MITILSGIIAFILFFVILPLIANFAKNISLKLDFALKAQQQSHEAAIALIDKGNLSKEMIEFVKWYQSNVGKPQIIRRLILDLLFKKYQQKITKRRHDALSKEIENFSEDEGQLFGEMISLGIISSSLSAVVLGDFYLAVWSFAGSDKNPTKEALRNVVDDLEPKFFKNLNHASC